MQKLTQFNSTEKEILTELFASYPNMDVKWITTLIENYIYEYATDVIQNIYKVQSRLRYGCLDGPTIVYWQDGTIMKKMSFIQDVCHGDLLVYHQNGRLSKQIQYHFGKMHHSYKEWNIFGILVLECSYNLGTLDGYYCRSSNSGIPLLECTYVNGLLHGNFRKNYTNGQVHIKTMYVCGNIEGEYYEWNCSGERIANKRYLRGKEVNKFRYLLQTKIL